MTLLFTGGAQNCGRRLQPHLQRDDRVHHGRDRVRAPVVGDVRRGRDVLQLALRVARLHRAQVPVHPGPQEPEVLRG